MPEESELEKAIVFVLGTLGELKRKGLVTTEGRVEALTEVGEELFRSIKESGWQPSRDMIRDVTQLFAGAPR